MLTEAEFVLIAREFKARTGGALTKEVSGAAEIRLQPLARREGFGSVNELVGAARIRPDGRLWQQISDYLLQSETRFFRDKIQFQKLREEILPAAAARAGGARVRIWSAACSTGQEPYSVAMLLEALRQEGQPINAEIIATDISERLIEKARAGLYSQFEVQRGLPIRSLIKHFEKAGDLWRIEDRLRAAVKFEQHNLARHPGHLGRVDVVLLMHVLPHLEQDAQLAAILNAADALAPGGVMVLGAGEDLPAGAEGLTCSGGIVTPKSAANVAAA